MREKMYKITDYDGHPLAGGLTFEMAMVFIRGYKDTFYNEPLCLVLTEEPLAPLAEDEI